MFKNLLSKPIAKAKENINEYVDLKLEYLKLSSIEKLAPVIASLAIVLLLMFVTSIMLFFLGMGIAKQFALWLNSEVGGYLLSAGVFLILAVILILLFKPIKQKLIQIIGKFFTQHL